VITISKSISQNPKQTKRGLLLTIVRLTVETPNSEFILRQTPAGQGVWDGIQFTMQPVERCDYLLVVMRPPQPITVHCPPQHIWAIIPEPPDEEHQMMHQGDVTYSRVYTSDPELQGGRYIQAQPALPWHVHKSYDFLRQAGVPDKSRPLSWITSNKVAYPGHRRRMAFLDKIRDTLDFDLYGRGFRPLEDKWDGLAPYRYSLAIENYSTPYYWSEKISDCFLAWTMPIYYGSPRISDYFPAEALVQIDIDDPLAPEKIREAIASDRWQRNLEAIAHARQLILERYQIFPFIAQEIRQHEASWCRLMHRPRPHRIPHKLRPPTAKGILSWYLHDYLLPAGLRQAAKYLLHHCRRWLSPKK
jgi:hypothetical protein